MKRILLAAALTAVLVASSVAQPGPEGPAPDPKTERQRNGAAKLAGLVAFVDASCPEMRGDPERLSVAVTRLGVDPVDLRQGELYLRAKAYTEIYQKDVPANCKRAVETFGEAGTAIPGLIVKK
ncbi:hypothetical protein [Methylobacterium soli]|uniref:Lipoprotein n=1 Tax=Methylobacterium soli TaxID=553447 RepID=A0A6L3T3W1_9HYPH|nr:hypothetical protein [Methylobacterium soli]KAB1081606.1 hypothetical protein F6X53_00400 [Methylobacterium soli]GJE45250.1 hypothetical protein AEGHOMDF_4444 [Methylobacterium soli]